MAPVLEAAQYAWHCFTWRVQLKLLDVRDISTVFILLQCREPYNSDCLTTVTLRCLEQFQCQSCEQKSKKWHRAPSFDGPALPFILCMPFVYERFAHVTAMCPADQLYWHCGCVQHYSCCEILRSLMTFQKNTGKTLWTATSLLRTSWRFLRRWFLIDFLYAHCT